LLFGVVVFKAARVKFCGRSVNVSWAAHNLPMYEIKKVKKRT